MDDRYERRVITRVRRLPSPHRGRAALALSLIASFAACSRDSGPTKPVAVAFVEITLPAAPTMFLGQIQTLTVSVMDDQRHTLNDRRVTWSSSNPSVVSVEPVGDNGLSGRVTARGAGSAKLTAVSGGKSSDVTVNVHPPGPVATVEVAPLSLDLSSSARLSVVLRDADGVILTGREITYGSADLAIATVSASGMVTPVAVGRTTVTATSEGKNGSSEVTVLTVPVFAMRAFIWTAADGMRSLGALPGFPDSDGRAINASGDVAGLSTNGTSEHAFHWTSTGGMVDLGVLPGGTISVANSVNSSGVVAGFSDAARTLAHAVLWNTNGTIQDLGTLPGDRESSAYAIDDVGRVVGVSSPTGAEGYAFLWTPAEGMKAIPGLRPGFSEASGMNNSGDVIGFDAGPDITMPRRRPFRWSAALGVRALPLLAGDTKGYPRSINDRGDVVGFSGYTVAIPCDYYGTCDTSVYHVVLWPDAGGVIDLSSVFRPSETVAINASGQVVGVGKSGYALLWSPGGATRDLGALPGHTRSYASSINDAGQVVGFSSRGAGTAAQRASAPGRISRSSTP